METVPSLSHLAGRGRVAKAVHGACSRAIGLRPRIEVMVGLKRWTAKTIGTVVRCERRRHGLHFRRQMDDKVYSDVIILKRDDGELTTVTMDEYTVLGRL